MPSILDIFKPKPVAPVAAVTTNPDGTPIQQPAGTAKVADATPAVIPAQTPGTDVNGVVPDNVNTVESPLDAFNDMWETDPNVKPTAEFSPEKLDPDKLQEVMSKVDLTKVITPENLALIQAGGEGATAALIESMNAVSQQTMMQSTLVANRMIEDSVKQAIDSVTAKIPALLKEQNLSNSLQEQNPIFSNPAVTPIMEAAQSQLQTKYPNATTSELAKMTQDYIIAMGKAFNPEKPASKESSSGEIDWSDFENAV